MIAQKRAINVNNVDMNYKGKLRVILGVGIVLFLFIFTISLYINMFTLNSVSVYRVIKVFCGLYFGGLLIYGLVRLINWCFKPLEK